MSIEEKGCRVNVNTTLYLIPFDGKEPSENDFKYSSRSIFVDGDYLYRGQWKELERYNLKTGEFEAANKEKNYGSVIKFVDEKVYLAQCVTLEIYYYHTKIYVEDLNTYEWNLIE